MTGQPQNDSDDSGLAVAITLVNEVSGTTLDTTPDVMRSVIEEILSVDPPSVAALTDADIAPLCRLADDLREIVTSLTSDDVDAGAGRVNMLLAKHSAHPHLAKEDGRWHLHHHPPDASVVPMWTAICADAFARLIGDDRTDRIGVCAADDCDGVYFDESKNASKRFCSTRCQNRVKASAFRSRHRSQT